MAHMLNLAFFDVTHLNLNLVYHVTQITVIFVVVSLNIMNPSLLHVCLIYVYTHVIVMQHFICDIFTVFSNRNLLRL